MNKELTEIVVILDRSWSMNSILEETIDGINKFFEEQRKLEGKAVVSAYQFDDHFEVLFENKDVKDVEPITNSTFVPRGDTCLYPAVGFVIDRVGQRLASLPESKRPGKVVFVIITDGENNTSRFKSIAVDGKKLIGDEIPNYTSEQVKSMTTHQTEKYSWQFVYIGANQDEWTVGGTLGVSSAATLGYVSTGKNKKDSVGAMYDSLTRNLSSYRVGSKSCFSFEDSDKLVQANFKSDQD